MSIEVKLIEEAPKPKPKFNIGDVVINNNNTIGLKPFEIIKVEKPIDKDTFIYWDKYGFYEWEDKLILHEEEKKQLTFGDVPVHSWFISVSGALCLKVYNEQCEKNTTIFINGQSCLVPFSNHEPITRILDGIEIREVKK